MQLEPFLKGTVISLKDESPKDTEELGSALEALRTSLSTMQQLQIKLKVSNSPVLDSMLFAEEVVILLFQKSLLLSLSVEFYVNPVC